MQVTSIDRGAGYFADYISGFSDGRYGDFLDADALVAVPAECQHSLIGTVVRFVRGGGGPITKLRFNCIGEEVMHD